MHKQLISYIAPAAPATRRPAAGPLPYLRPEIGFTPKWYHQSLGIDFGEPWHTSPVLRSQSIHAMRAELRRRFPGTFIGQIEEPSSPLDLLTGTFGACTTAALFGIPIIYAQDNWPNCKHEYLTDDQVDYLESPNLDCNPFFQDLLQQVDQIARLEGQARGYINWQGILNNAQRLRGESLFYDLFDQPHRCHRLFRVICETMIQAGQRLHARQQQSGFDPGFFTVSNCLVNMVSPQQYLDYLLPYDRQIAEAFGCIGIHNCAWNAGPYMEAYAQVPNLQYVDMGLESDLVRAKKLFPNARRALMYTPMDLANKDMQDISADLERIAREYAPCDVVVADIEAGTPDEKVIEFVRLCQAVSKQHASLSAP